MNAADSDRGVLRPALCVGIIEHQRTLSGPLYLYRTAQPAHPAHDNHLTPTGSVSDAGTFHLGRSDCLKPLTRVGPGSRKET